MRAAAARIEGMTFESILTRAVFESPLALKMRRSCRELISLSRDKGVLQDDRWLELG